MSALVISLPLASQTSDPYSAFNDKFVDWMSRHLKDPESAKWQRTSEIQYKSFNFDIPEFDPELQKTVLKNRDFSGFFVCYRVNSKNSYGAYGGSRKFLAFEAKSGLDFRVWYKGMKGDLSFRAVAEQLAKGCPD